MNWHPEVLGRRQLGVLKQIGPALSRRSFHLVGGTAVALYLGHRRSVDFDWFTLNRFDPLSIADELREEGIAFVTASIAEGTLHGLIHGVHVRLIRHNYPLLARSRLWQGRTRIASLADLAAMKLSAIAQRGAKKDFVDLFAIGRKSDSLIQMLKWYQKKFATTDIAHLLYSLSYFQDAETQRLPKMFWPIKWRDIKKVIAGWVTTAS